MKHFKLLLIFMCVALSAYSQNKTSTFTKTINLDPQNSNGMLGNVTMVYAFTNCFGDAVMAFGYQNANFTAVRYKGKEYTAEDLGLSSLDNETTSFNVSANYYYGNGFIKVNRLTYILNSYDVGCYGQTNTISSGNKAHNTNLNSLSVNFEEATFRISGSLAFKIDNYEKEKLRLKQFFELLEKAENTSDPQQQLEKLREADRYAKTGGEKRMVENIRVKVQGKIDKLKQEELNKEEEDNTTTNYKDDEEEVDEEEVDEVDEETEGSRNQNSSEYSSINKKPKRQADLSSQKTTAATTLLATSALLASQSSRIGLGGRANMGDELFSYGPELYFMFDDSFGMNVHYALGDDDTFGIEDTFDAYEIGVGLIFDFSKAEKNNLIDDGFGIGIEALYGQFERDVIGESSSYRTYFEEGNILSVGASLYLGVLKVGYTLPVSFERVEDDVVDDDYNPGGSIILGLFFFF